MKQPDDELWTKIKDAAMWDYLAWIGIICLQILLIMCIGGCARAVRTVSEEHLCPVGYHWLYRDHVHHRDVCGRDSIP